MLSSLEHLCSTRCGSRMQVADRFFFSFSGVPFFPLSCQSLTRSATIKTHKVVVGTSDRTLWGAVLPVLWLPCYGEGEVRMADKLRIRSDQVVQLDKAKPVAGGWLGAGLLCRFALRCARRQIHHGSRQAQSAGRIWAVVDAAENCGSGARQ